MNSRRIRREERGHLVFGGHAPFQSANEHQFTTELVLRCSEEVQSTPILHRILNSVQQNT